MSAVVRGYDPDRRGQAREALVEIDLVFLLPLGVGMVTAVALIAGAVSALANSHPVVLYGFSLADRRLGGRSLPSLEFASAEHVLAAAAGTGLAVLVASNVIQLPGSGPLLILVAGAFAISAMILPGVSGALILILIGQYEFLSTELTAFRGPGNLVSGWDDRGGPRAGDDRRVVRRWGSSAS